MSGQLQLRRGTTAENNAFTGAVGEVTVDTTLDQLRVHDGATAGGHTVGGLTSPVAIADGGTGQTTAAGAVDALGGAGSTGSGGLVRATTPTLVTPILGTPTSGTLTNCTGLPVSSVVGITAAAQTVLDDATVSAMVDTLGGASATGSGGLVRATSPTLVTPALGTPASGTLTNCTGLPVAGLVTFPIVHTLEFYSTGATAANAGVRGILNTTDTASAIRVPSGKTLKVLTASGSIKSGATAGTYTLEVSLRNVTDSTYTTLASTTVTASTIAYPDAVGTYASPLGTLAGPKEFAAAFFNNASSPGALDATHKHHVILTYIIE